jgi:putative adhesin
MKTLPRRTAAVRAVLPLLLVVSAATAGCDLALADFKQKETAEWRKSYELSPGGHLEISNVNGKIDVEPATGNTVEIVAEKSARGASSEAAKEALRLIEIVETVSPSSIRIETKMQRTGGVFNHGGNTQVHYTVKVPASAEVKFTTVNGGIELTGMAGRVKAETTNGGVKAHGVSGPIEASTTNGGVEVELTSMPEGGVKLECTNGGIELRLPSSAKATISARITNGGINTNGVEISPTGDSTKRRLDGTMNGGGPRIDIEGTNGGIRISGR